MNLVETLLRTNSNACVALKGDCSIVHLNSNFSNLLPWAHEPTKGEDFLELWHPSSQSSFRELIGRSRVGGEAPPTMIARPNLIGQSEDVKLSAYATSGDQEDVALLVVAELSAGIGASETTDAFREAGGPDPQNAWLAYPTGPELDESRNNNQWHKSGQIVGANQFGGDAGIFTWNLETGDLTVSTSLMRQLGYDLATIDDPMAFITSLYHPDDLAAFDAVLKEAISDKKSYRTQIRLRDSEGRYCSFLLRGQPILNDQGDVVSMIGTETDITELVELNDQFRRAEEIANIGTWRRRIGSDFAHWSPGMWRLFEQPFQAAPVSRWASYDLVHKDDRPILEFLESRLIERWQRGEEPEEQNQVRYALPDGSFKHCVSRSTLVMDADGNPFEMVGTVQEISEQVELNNTLLRAEQIGKFGNWTRKIADDDQIWSPGMYDIFGWDPELSEVLRSRALAAVHPDDRDDLSKLAERLLGAWPTDPNAVERVRARVLRPDNSTRHVSFIARLEAGAEGEPLRVVGTAQDVTDMVELETNLLRAEEIAKMGSWRRRVGQDSLYWSPGVWKMYGREPRHGTFTRQEAYGTVHPDDRPILEFLEDRLLEKWRNGEEPVERHQVRYLLPDGTVGHYQNLGILELDADGNPFEIAGTMQDISEQVELNNTLLRAEKLAKVGNWTRTIGKDERVWSPGMFAIFGWDPVRTNPSTADLLASVHPEDHESITGVETRLLRKWNHDRTAVEHFRFRIVLSDGSVKHVSVNAVIEADAEGQPARIVGTAMDITDLAEAEQRLLTSQKMEVVGKLAGGAAHDFNNLLAVIMGNLELMDLDEDREEWDSFKENALEATKRGAVLTRNLLSFARKAVLSPVRLDLNQTMLDMMKVLRRVLPENIRIEMKEGEDLWSVHADKLSFENAILNLAINARDAMGSGGVLTIESENKVLTEVYVEERQETLQPGPYVVFSISDTGDGIPPELLTEVFTPYFTTKPVDQGSGLGLSMVHGFMRQTGGGLRLYSEVGVGTTVKLFFPAMALEASLEADETDAALSLAVAGRVLLVEDNANVRFVLEKQLTAMGLDCVAAESGDDAVKVFEQSGRFDLVVTDVVMPGALQGPEMAQVLRERQPDLKIIYITGYPNEATIHGNGLRHEDVRLMKPVSKAELVKAINDLTKTKAE